MSAQLRKRLVGLALLAAPALLAGCTPGVLNPRGPVALAERTILFDSMLIMLAIIVPTIMGTLAFAFWYRTGNRRAVRLPEFAYSGQIELVTWGIPTLTIILLGGVAWVGSHELDPARPLPGSGKPLEVQVVSLDWKWLFIYPGQNVAAVNQLVIPAGRPVHFMLTSASVMNAFFIPQLGSMIYTMNGMASELNLQADAPGGYEGISAHYSGDGFSDMNFEVRSVPPAQFDSWVAGAGKDGKVLDVASYKQIWKQTTHVPVSTYHLADAGLFAEIVSHKLAPAPGPVESGGGQAGQAQSTLPGKRADLKTPAAQAALASGVP